MDNITLLGHSSIKITGNKVIYIDPFRIEKEYNDADYIFITHSHYDHYSKEDILKVKKDSTTIVITSDLLQDTLSLGFSKSNILVVESNNRYKLDELEVETIPAYNNLKLFHPKRNGWVGYILNVNSVLYYITGDTDITEDNKKVKCDVALVPVGGTYTMDSKDAAKLVNILKPKLAIPIHYGSIVGSKKDAQNFSNLLDKAIECKILM